MKKHFSFLLCLPLLISCFPSQDLFPYVDDFKTELSANAIDRCLRDNPKAKRSDCNIKNCLVSPITLLGMQELLIDADKVLREVGLKYWLDFGTAISAARFAGHLPWDDDDDLGVLSADFTDDVKTKLASKFRKIGLEFKPIIGSGVISSMVGYKGLWQLAYLKPRLTKLILSYKPDISTQDLETLWLKYERETSKRPHLDIFLYDEVSPGQYTLRASTSRTTKKTLSKDIIIGPPNEVEVLGKTFLGVQDIRRYGKIIYGSDDIMRDFVIYGQRSDICGKTRYKNINDFPETRDFILDYLDFVFNSDAAKSMGMSFDKAAALNKLR